MSELLALCKRGDVEGCIAWLVAADEPARRAEAPAVMAAVRTFWNDRSTDADGDAWRRPLEALKIAVPGTCTLAELRKLDTGTPKHRPALVEVLRARRPAWLQEYGEWLIDPKNSLTAASALRPLVTAGLVAWPRTVAGLESWLADAWSSPHDAEPTAATLSSDAALLESMWPLLFDFDWGSSGGSLHIADAIALLVRRDLIPRDRALAGCISGLLRDTDARSMRSYVRLAEALEPTVDELAAHAVTLLDLAASRNPTTQAFALARLGELLRGASIDPERLVAALVPAMSSRGKTVVTKALSLAQAAARKSKAVAPAAARLGLLALQHEAPGVQEAGAKLVAALGDPGDASLVSEARAAATADASGTASAAARATLAGWLPAATGEGEPAPVEAPAAVEALASQPEVADARPLDPRWSRAAAVEEAEAAAARDDLPAALRLPWPLPVLRESDRLQLLTSGAEVDRLIGLFSAMLENRGTGEDFELALDGISRLCGHVPPDLARKLGGLRPRAVDRVRRRDSIGQAIDGDAATEAGVRVLVQRLREIRASLGAPHEDKLGPLMEPLVRVTAAQLVLAWTDGGGAPAEPTPSLPAPSDRSAGERAVPRLGARVGALMRGWLGDKSAKSGELGSRSSAATAPDATPDAPWAAETWKRSPMAFLGRRALAVAGRVARREPAPLLATPTHRGGWIDPLILIERMGWWAASPLEPDLGDMVQALLRVAPRPGALAAISGAGLPSTELLSALRHALDAPDVAVGPTRALWLAAARARQPWGDDEAVAAVHGSDLPDGARAARIRFDIRRPRVPAAEKPAAANEPQRVIRRWHDESSSLVANVEGSTKGAPLELATALLGASKVTWFDSADMAWTLTIAPALREVVCARHVDGLSSDPDQTWHWSAQPLRVLAEPDEPLGPAARTFVALCLGAKDARLMTAASDVLIASIADGRLGADGFAQALTLVLSLANTTPSRWPKALGEAARTSPLHAAVVRAAIERGVPWTLLDARQALPFLELLRELGSQLGERVESGELRAWLAALGGGRSGQVAAALLAAEHAPSHPARRRASSLAVEARVARARRWASAAAESGSATA